MKTYVHLCVFMYIYVYLCTFMYIYVHLCTFMTPSRWMILNTRNSLENSCSKNRKIFNIQRLSRQPFVYEMMLENMVHPDRPQMTI